MNQLVVAVQLEANIIGQQLWIGSSLLDLAVREVWLMRLELSVIPLQM